MSTTANIRNALAEFGAGLRPSTRSALERVVQMPEARAFIEQEDNALMMKRQGWSKALALVPKKYAATGERVSRELRVAKERLEKAREELAAANAAEMAAVAATYSVTHAATSEECALQQMLRESADARLGIIVRHCQELLDFTRNSVQLSIQVTGWYPESGKPTSRLTSNAEEIDKVRAEIAAVMGRAQEAHYAPISYSAMTGRIRRMVEDLQEHVTILGRPPLCLAEDGSLTMDPVTEMPAAPAESAVAE